MSEGNTSLRWKLSWQLSVTFVAIVALLIVGLAFYGATVLSPNLVLEKKVSLAMEDAIVLDSQGRLEIRDTPGLRSIRSQTEGLWYVVATARGEMVSYGDIPASYADLAPFVYRFHEADIRGAADTSEIASIETVYSAAGEVRIMLGKTSGTDWVVPVLLVELKPIYLPLLGLTLPAIFLAVPRIVQRSLSGVNDVARRAAAIEPRSRGARLPTKTVPREVAPLIVAFNGALERLDAEFQKRQRFLVDAAHELRTPIAIMQIRIEGMAEGQDRQRLLKDVARLGGTAEQLLDFERNDLNEDPFETIDLVDVARMAVADLAPLAIAAGYEISFHSDADKLERQGSPSAMTRAVSNLVRNAIDHAGNAGMISISVSADGHVEVADQGPGIPFDQRELVFEPFYRVTPRSTGAGLGLSLVRQIVTNHGGQVLLDSGTAGTKLTIRI
jgi:signal transduction histidine kinase